MGKRRVTPGTGQVNLEIESSLLERLRVFAGDRNEKIRHVVEMAIRRHLDYPPPPPQEVEVMPLPPVTSGNAGPATARLAKKAKASKRPK